MKKVPTFWLSVTMFQNMSEAYQLQDLLELVFLLTTFVLVNLPTLTTQVLQLICSLFLHFIYFVLYFKPYFHAI